MTMATIDSRETPGPLATFQHDNFKHALEPTSLEAAYRVATVAAKIGIGGVRSPEEALIRIMHGRTLGITSMQALRFVYVVNGRAAVDSTLLRALCLSHPECEEFALLESTPQAATFRARRRGHAAVTLTWTLEDAKRARLLEKDSWRAYPAQMLRARVTADLARLVFPDAVAGLPLGHPAVEVHADVEGAEVEREEAPTIGELDVEARHDHTRRDERDSDSSLPAHEDEEAAAVGLSRATEEPKQLRDIWREELEAQYEAMAAHIESAEGAA
jgi:hypothetical protein